MKAVIHQRYGREDVLEIAQVEVPSARRGEVLVRVKAASLNPADKFLMLGRPVPVRLMLGLTQPSAGHRVRGNDLSGVVVAAGEGVDRLKTGDEVFGSTEGALAEYVRGKESVFAIKPSVLSFEEAASLPMAGLAALHGLRDAARVKAGDSVLIIGASGGIGTLAVQIAKSMAATVTGVCSSRNVELVRSLGADDVIDYVTEDLTRTNRRFDVIFDNVGNHPLATLRILLTPDGILLPNSGEAGPDGGPILKMIKGAVVSLFGRQKIRAYMSTANGTDLGLLATMVEEGKLRPVIDEVFPLDRAREAMSRLASRHARGKVVIDVSL